MKTKVHHQNNFTRIITLPVRVFNKVVDFYVKSITNCGSRVSYGSVMGVPGGHMYTLPRSFSVSSSLSNDSEDFRELIRVASVKSLGNRVNMDLYMQQEQKSQSQTTLIGSRGMPRSCSVGMGRIDEDKPCVFGEDNFNLNTELMFPRSRSYAVARRNVAF
ncbi:unnamed protein product [Ilex paraguariensis]|uniref:Uncharacterized protein n=1 Tax=Ilex paraguariensis TaxID=185542 RepID=A0ABC8RNH7_9AQUA